MKTEICAHRGASCCAPENTLQAFALAIAVNADSIELDTHLTKDGVCVVSHDGSLGRCADGSGNISDMTLAELEEYSFCAGYPKLGYCKIPTMQEVLHMMKPTGLKINVEIKGGIGRIEEKLAALVREEGMVENVYYSSFVTDALINIKKYEPRCTTGYLVGEAPENIVDICVKNSFDALHCWQGALYADTGLVNRLHEKNILVRPWTVDSPDDIRAMLNLGVDAIITDYPVRARYLRDNIEG